LFLLFSRYTCSAMPYFFILSRQGHMPSGSLAALLQYIASRLSTSFHLFRRGVGTFKRNFVFLFSTHQLAVGRRTAALIPAAWCFFFFLMTRQDAKSTNKKKEHGERNTPRADSIFPSSQRKRVRRGEWERHSYKHRATVLQRHPPPRQGLTLAGNVPLVEVLLL